MSREHARAQISIWCDSLGAERGGGRGQRARRTRSTRACSMKNTLPVWPGAGLDVRDATTLPAEYYTSEEAARVERRNVWGAGWLPACLSRDVALPGSQNSCSLLPRGPGHMPVLVCRDADGVLRAFKNLCSHRAYAVVTEDRRGGTAGCGGRLSCGYHGWSYSMSDGRCIGAPKMTGCRDFHMSENSLQELNLCERGALVFVDVGSCG